MRSIIILGIMLCAIVSGCTSCNTPNGPSNSNGGGGGGGGGTTVTTLVHETYEVSPYTGNWLAPDPNATFAPTTVSPGAGAYSVAFYSVSLNATTADHFRNTFGTVAPATPLTTSFMFNADQLNFAGTQNLTLHLQMSDNLVKWYFEIVGQGASYRFNNSTLSSCAHCPAPNSGWHKVTVASTGTTTTALAFDSFPSETTFAANYTGGVIPDVLGLDILHITTGNCLNTAGARFLLDEFTVTTP